MQIWFSQAYVQPIAWFPLSTSFQEFMSDEVSRLTVPSTKFVQEFGKTYKIGFNISAKTKTLVPEIVGPAVSRRRRNVEYTIFLPYSKIIEACNWQESAANMIMDGVEGVFADWEFDLNQLRLHRSSIIKTVVERDDMEEQWE